MVAMLELLGAIELVVATDERELGATELGITELVVAIEELLGRELELELLGLASTRTYPLNVALLWPPLPSDTVNVAV